MYNSIDNQDYNPKPEESIKQDNDLQKDTIENIHRNIQEQAFSIKHLILQRKNQSKAIQTKFNELELTIRDRLAHMNGSITSPETLKRKTDLQQNLLDIELNRIQEKTSCIESATRLEIRLIEIDNQKNWIQN